MKSVGIRSLAVAYPSIVRTNDHFRSRFPHLVDEGRPRGQLFDALDPSQDSYPFDIEMLPYASDPFRGTVERRALGPGETPLTISRRAAVDAVTAADLRPQDIDLLLSAAFLPEHVGIGDAPFLARDLGLGGAAWNLESACSSAVVAIQNACAMVQAGMYRNVLVTISCTYSRVMDESDPLSWFLGDGAGAFVIGEVEEGSGLVAGKIHHTGESCGTIYWGLELDDGGQPRIAVRSAKGAGRTLRDTSAPVLRKCCQGAADAAGVSLRDVDAFVFNTPTAWFDKFAARALDIDPARTLTTYPTYANMGPALTTANLYRAAQVGLIREGSLVLVYSVGSVSSAGALIMRWGRTALGPAP